MTEAEFATAVYDLLRLRGWRWQHQRPAKTAKGWRTAIEGDAGFPDIVAARAGVVLLIELKRNGGSLSSAQIIWAAALGHGSIDALMGPGRFQYHCWHPRDWPRIEEVLR